MYYSEWQAGYEDSEKNIEFKEGLPQSTDCASHPGQKFLIIIDDLLRESLSASAILNLVAIGIVHNNFSVIFITQNVLNQDEEQRGISLNSHYIVLFIHLRDRAHVQHLLRQICPDLRL